MGCSTHISDSLGVLGALGVSMNFFRFIIVCRNRSAAAPYAIPLARLLGLEEGRGVERRAFAVVMRPPVREVTLISVIAADAAYGADQFA